MANNKLVRSFLPILLFFLITTILFLVAHGWLFKLGVNTNVLLGGNAILFLATAISFFFYSRAIKNNRVYVFIRMIYGGMLIKMFICLVTAFIYISTVRKEVNKPALFTCMFFYLVYSFAEIYILLKLSKQPKDE